MRTREESWRTYSSLSHVTTTTLQLNNMMNNSERWPDLLARCVLLQFYPTVGKPFFKKRRPRRLKIAQVITQVRFIQEPSPRALRLSVTYPSDSSISWNSHNIVSYRKKTLPLPRQVGPGVLHRVSFPHVTLESFWFASLYPVKHSSQTVSSIW